jgi:hypothetical protein
MQDIKIMLSDLADKVEGLVNAQDAQDIKMKLAVLSDMIERSIETKEVVS